MILLMNVTQHNDLLKKHNYLYIYKNHLKLCVAHDISLQTCKVVCDIFGSSKIIMQCDIISMIIYISNKARHVKNEASCIFRNRYRFGSYKVYLNDTRISNTKCQILLSTNSLLSPDVTSVLSVQMVVKGK